MEKNISIEVLEVTPEMAKVMLEKNASNQRLLNHRIVNLYVKDILDGVWELTSDTIKLTADGTLIDGQHRLNAIVKANTPVKLTVARNVSERAQSKIDRNKPRTMCDIFRMHGIKNYAAISTIVGLYLSMKGSSTNARKSKAVMNVTDSDFMTEYNSSPELYQEIFELCQAGNRQFRAYKISETASIAIYLIKEKGWDQPLVSTWLTNIFNGNSQFKCINTLCSKIINDASSSIKMNQKHRIQLYAKCWNITTTGNKLKNIRLIKDEDFVDFVGNTAKK